MSSIEDPYAAQTYRTEVTASRRQPVPPSFTSEQQQQQRSQSARPPGGIERNPGRTLLSKQPRPQGVLAMQELAKARDRRASEEAAFQRTINKKNPNASSGEDDEDDGIDRGRVVTGGAANFTPRMPSARPASAAPLSQQEKQEQQQLYSSQRGTSSNPYEDKPKQQQPQGNVYDLSLMSPRAVIESATESSKQSTFTVLLQPFRSTAMQGRASMHVENCGGLVVNHPTFHARPSSATSSAAAAGGNGGSGGGGHAASRRTPLPGQQDGSSFSSTNIMHLGTVSGAHPLHARFSVDRGAPHGTILGATATVVCPQDEATFVIFVHDTESKQTLSINTQVLLREERRATVQKDMQELRDALELAKRHSDDLRAQLLRCTSERDKALDRIRDVEIDVQRLTSERNRLSAKERAIEQDSERLREMEQRLMQQRAREDEQEQEMQVARGRERDAMRQREQERAKERQHEQERAREREAERKAIESERLRMNNERIQYAKDRSAFQAFMKQVDAERAAFQEREQQWRSSIQAAMSDVAVCEACVSRKELERNVELAIQRVKEMEAERDKMATDLRSVVDAEAARLSSALSLGPRIHRSFCMFAGSCESFFPLSNAQLSFRGAVHRGRIFVLLQPKVRKMEAPVINSNNNSGKLPSRTDSTSQLWQQAQQQEQQQHQLQHTQQSDTNNIRCVVGFRGAHAAHALSAVGAPPVASNSIINTNVLLNMSRLTIDQPDADAATSTGQVEMAFDLTANYHWASSYGSTSISSYFNETEAPSRNLRLFVEPLAGSSNPAAHQAVSGLSADLLAMDPAAFQVAAERQKRQQQMQQQMQQGISPSSNIYTVEDDQQQQLHGGDNDDDDENNGVKALARRVIMGWNSMKLRSEFITGPEPPAVAAQPQQKMQRPEKLKSALTETANSGKKRTTDQQPQAPQHQQQQGKRAAQPPASASAPAPPAKNTYYVSTAAFNETMRKQPHLQGWSIGGGGGQQHVALVLNATPLLAQHLPAGAQLLCFELAPGGTLAATTVSHLLKHLTLIAFEADDGVSMSRSASRSNSHSGTLVGTALGDVTPASVAMPPAAVAVANASAVSFSAPLISLEPGPLLPAPASRQLDPPALDITLRFATCIEVMDEIDLKPHPLERIEELQATVYPTPNCLLHKEQQQPSSLLFTKHSGGNPSATANSSVFSENALVVPAHGKPSWRPAGDCAFMNYSALGFSVNVLHDAQSERDARKAALVASGLATASSGPSSPTSAGPLKDFASIRNYNNNNNNSISQVPGVFPFCGESGRHFCQMIRVPLDSILNTKSEWDGPAGKGAAKAMLRKKQNKNNNRNVSSSSSSSSSGDSSEESDGEVPHDFISNRKLRRVRYMQVQLRGDSVNHNSAGPGEITIAPTHFDRLTGHVYLARQQTTSDDAPPSIVRRRVGRVIYGSVDGISYDERGPKRNKNTLRNWSRVRSMAHAVGSLHSSGNGSGGSSTRDSSMHFSASAGGEMAASLNFSGASHRRSVVMFPGVGGDTGAASIDAENGDFEDVRYVVVEFDSDARAEHDVEVTGGDKTEAGRSLSWAEMEQLRDAVGFTVTSPAEDPSAPFGGGAGGIGAAAMAADVTAGAAGDKARKKYRRRSTAGAIIGDASAFLQQQSIRTGTRLVHVTFSGLVLGEVDRFRGVEQSDLLPESAGGGDEMPPRSPTLDNTAPTERRGITRSATPPSVQGNSLVSGIARSDSIASSQHEQQQQQVAGATARDDEEEAKKFQHRPMRISFGATVSVTNSRGQFVVQHGALSGTFRGGLRCNTSVQTQTPASGSLLLPRFALQQCLPVCPLPAKLVVSMGSVALDELFFDMSLGLVTIVPHAQCIDSVRRTVILYKRCQVGIVEQQTSERVQIVLNRLATAAALQDIVRTLAFRAGMSTQTYSGGAAGTATDVVSLARRIHVELSVLGRTQWTEFVTLSSVPPLLDFPFDAPLSRTEGDAVAEPLLSIPAANPSMPPLSISLPPEIEVLTNKGALAIIVDIRPATVERSITASAMAAATASVDPAHEEKLLPVQVNLSRKALLSAGLVLKQCRATCDDWPQQWLRRAAATATLQNSPRDARWIRDRLAACSLAGGVDPSEMFDLAASPTISSFSSEEEASKIEASAGLVRIGSVAFTSTGTLVMVFPSAAASWLDESLAELVAQGITPVDLDVAPTVKGTHVQGALRSICAAVYSSLAKASQCVCAIRLLTEGPASTASSGGGGVGAERAAGGATGSGALGGGVGPKAPLSAAGATGVSGVDVSLQSRMGVVPVTDSIDELISIQANRVLRSSGIVPRGRTIPTALHAFSSVLFVHAASSLTSLSNVDSWVRGRVTAPPQQIAKAAIAPNASLSQAPLSWSRGLATVSISLESPVPPGLEAAIVIAPESTALGRALLVREMKPDDLLDVSGGGTPTTPTSATAKGGNKFLSAINSNVSGSNSRKAATTTATETKSRPWARLGVVRAVPEWETLLQLSHNSPKVFSTLPIPHTAVAAAHAFGVSSGVEMMPALAALDDNNYSSSNNNKVQSPLAAQAMASLVINNPYVDETHLLCFNGRCVGTVVVCDPDRDVARLMAEQQQRREKEARAQLQQLLQQQQQQEEGKGGASSSTTSAAPQTPLSPVDPHVGFAASANTDDTMSPQHRPSPGFSHLRYAVSDLASSMMNPSQQSRAAAAPVIVPPKPALFTATMTTLSAAEVSSFINSLQIVLRPSAAAMKHANSKDSYRTPLLGVPPPTTVRISVTCNPPTTDAAWNVERSAVSKIVWHAPPLCFDSGEPVPRYLFAKIPASMQTATGFNLQPLSLFRRCQVGNFGLMHTGNQPLDVGEATVPMGTSVSIEVLPSFGGDAASAQQLQTASGAMTAQPSKIDCTIDTAVATLDMGSTRNAFSLVPHADSVFKRAPNQQQQQQQQSSSSSAGGGGSGSVPTTLALFSIAAQQQQDGPLRHGALYSGRTCVADYDNVDGTCMSLTQHKNHLKTKMLTSLLRSVQVSVELVTSATSSGGGKRGDAGPGASSGTSPSSRQGGRRQSIGGTTTAPTSATASSASKDKPQLMPSTSTICLTFRDRQLGVIESYFVELLWTGSLNTAIGCPFTFVGIPRRRLQAVMPRSAPDAPSSFSGSQQQLLQQQNSWNAAPAAFLLIGSEDPARIGSDIFVAWTTSGAGHSDVPDSGGSSSNNNNNNNNSQSGDLLRRKLPRIYIEWAAGGSRAGGGNVRSEADSNSGWAAALEKGITLRATDIPGVDNITDPNKLRRGADNSNNDSDDQGQQQQQQQQNEQLQSRYSFRGGGGGQDEYADQQDVHAEESSFNFNVAMGGFAAAEGEDFVSSAASTLLGPAAASAIAKKTRLNPPPFLLPTPFRRESIRNALVPQGTFAAEGATTQLPGQWRWRWTASTEAPWSTTASTGGGGGNNDNSNNNTLSSTRSSNRRGNNSNSNSNAQNNNMVERYLFLETGMDPEPCTAPIARILRESQSKVILVVDEIELASLISFLCEANVLRLDLDAVPVDLPLNSRVVRLVVSAIVESFFALAAAEARPTGTGEQCASDRIADPSVEPILRGLGHFAFGIVHQTASDGGSNSNNNNNSGGGGHVSASAAIATLCKRDIFADITADPRGPAETAGLSAVLVKSSSLAGAALAALRTSAALNVGSNQSLGVGAPSQLQLRKFSWKTPLGSPFARSFSKPGVAGDLSKRMSNYATGITVKFAFTLVPKNPQTVQDDLLKAAHLIACTMVRSATDNTAAARRLGKDSDNESSGSLAASGGTAVPSASNVTSTSLPLRKARGNSLPGVPGVLSATPSEIPGAFQPPTSSSNGGGGENLLSPSSTSAGEASFTPSAPPQMFDAERRAVFLATVQHQQSLQGFFHQQSSFAMPHLMLRWGFVAEIEDKDEAASLVDLNAIEIIRIDDCEGIASALAASGTAASTGPTVEETTRQAEEIMGLNSITSDGAAPEYAAAFAEESQRVHKCATGSSVASGARAGLSAPPFFMLIQPATGRVVGAARFRIARSSQFEAANDAANSGAANDAAAHQPQHYHHFGGGLMMQQQQQHQQPLIRNLPPRDCELVVVFRDGFRVTRRILERLLCRVALFSNSSFSGATLAAATTTSTISKVIATGAAAAMGGSTMDVLAMSRTSRRAVTTAENEKERLHHHHHRDRNVFELHSSCSIIDRVHDAVLARIVSDPVALHF